MSVTYYVSKLGSNTSGQSWATAFWTLEQALVALGTSPGVIEVGPGKYDAPKSGIVLHSRQTFRSAGSNATTIDANTVAASVRAVITAVGERIRICGFRLEDVRGIGVHVTNADLSTTTEDVLVEDMFVEMTGQHSMAYGIGYRTISPPDGEVTRVFEVVLQDCSSKGSGQSTSHMQIGSNSTGRVHGVRNIGGHSQDNEYGVFIGGGSLVSTGLNFHNSSEADIYCYQNAIGQIHISGGNSTHSHRFLDHRMFGAQAYNGLLIENYYVEDLQNSDGQAVLTAAGPLRLHNITLFGATCPQYIAYRLEGFMQDRDTVGRVEVDGLTSEHPYPIGGSPYSRPGRIIEAKNVRFVGDPGGQMRTNRSPERQVRRMNVPATPNALYLNSRYATEFVVGLEADADPPTLTSGVVGQIIGLTFEQNGAKQSGVGRFSYEWPANCAFDGGPKPPINTSPLNRQSCRFMWNGSYWEQLGSVSNVVPPRNVPAFAPVVDNFTEGNPFWLSVPTGTANGQLWEHVPGGGSLGIVNVTPNQKACVVNSLGWVGDNGIDLVWDSSGPLKPVGAGLLGSALTGGAGLIMSAAAVIETGHKKGSANTTKISTTFKWYNFEGIIARYKDDQTFWVFTIGRGPQWRMYAYGWSHGMPSSGGPRRFDIDPLTPGQDCTLIVECTSTGFVVTVNGGNPQTLNIPDIEKWRKFTKHGIVASDTRVQFTNFSVS